MRFNGALLRRFFYPQKYNLPCHIMARQDVNLRFKKIQLLIMKNGFFLAITLSFNYVADGINRQQNSHSRTGTSYDNNGAISSR